jgi:hypothetical protein
MKCKKGGKKIYNTRTPNSTVNQPTFRVPPVASASHPLPVPLLDKRLLRKGKEIKREIETFIDRLILSRKEPSLENHCQELSLLEEVWTWLMRLL